MEVLRLDSYKTTFDLKGKEHKSERKHSVHTCFLSTMIDPNGILAQVMDDAMEDGCSEQATAICNQYSLEIGGGSFTTRNQVRDLTRKLDLVVTAVCKAKQGGNVH